MKHRNYHSFRAKDNYELGLMLGTEFGEVLRKSVESRLKTENRSAKVDKVRQCLEITRNFFPQYIRELEGYAEASGVDFIDLWALSLEDEFWDDKKPDKCASIVTNEGRLIAHNEDWGKNAKDAVCVLRKTVGNVTVLELYYYNTPGGNAVSVNSHGYVQMVNTLTHSDRQIGIPRNIIARWLSETADPEKDYDKLAALKRSSGYNHVIVYKTGAVWDIECSATAQRLMKPSMPFAHTNHYLSDLKIFEANDNSTGTLERYETAVGRAKNAMTVEELARLTNAAGIMNERTIGKMIIDLDNLVAKVWLLREEDSGWIDYELDYID